MKYPKPLISLMNVEDAVLQRLSVTEGYNVEKGSFGNVYKKQETNRFEPVYLQNSMPSHFEESDIVIIDLKIYDIHDIYNYSNGDLALDKGGNKLFIETRTSLVDSRIDQMYRSQNAMNRILSHGGIFIVFAEPKKEYNFHVGEYNSNRPMLFNNYGFLDALSSLKFQQDQGNQINVVNNINFAPIFAKFFKEADFSCNFRMSGNHDLCSPILMNKFGDTVGAMIERLNGEDKKHGLIFLLPHPRDKAGFLSEFLGDILPILQPSLFPYFEGEQWISDDKYQSKRVLELKAEIHGIQIDADQKVNELRQKIDIEQNKFLYQIDLITQTGAELVFAVKKALEVLGFKDVVNYDDELASTGSSGMREDLHIRDHSPLILVEIKGVKGRSTEGSALQVIKYLLPRAKELGTTDIRGLSIINHQRNLPPLNRELNPFSKDVLMNAAESESGFGLLTTWNLYKLVRNYLNLGWTHEQVRGLFNTNGYIEPIPTHYHLIGVVHGFIEKLSVVGIELNQGELNLGETIAFELEIEFEVQEVESLEINNQSVNLAELGKIAGIKTTLRKDQLLLGKTRVFRVS